MSDEPRQRTNGHVLAALIYREKIITHQDLWKPAPLLLKLPGGRIEWNESPEEAMIRELAEELRLRFRPGELMLLHQRQMQGAGGHPYTQYLFGMEANWRKFKPYKPLDPRFNRIDIPLADFERRPDVETSHRSLIREIALNHEQDEPTAKAA